jgi:transcriptional regulator with XRE-family HTH domain
MREGFGKRVAIARIARGLDKKQIADATGARPNTVGDWERMETADLREVYLKALAKTLDTTVEWLVDGDIPRPPRPGEGAGYRGIAARLRQVVGEIEGVLVEVTTPTPPPVGKEAPDVKLAAAATQASGQVVQRVRRQPRDQERKAK